MKFRVCSRLTSLPFQIKFTNLARLISLQKRSVIVTVLLVCVLGIYAATQLPTAIFPNTDFPRVVIIVDNGDVPADQMLATVTQPV